MPEHIRRSIIGQTREAGMLGSYGQGGGSEDARCVVEQGQSAGVGHMGYGCGEGRKCGRPATLPAGGTVRGYYIAPPPPSAPCVRMQTQTSIAEAFQLIAWPCCHSVSHAAIVCDQARCHAACETGGALSVDRHPALRRHMAKPPPGCWPRHQHRQGVGPAACACQVSSPSTSMKASNRWPPTSFLHRP